MAKERCLICGIDKAKRLCKIKDQIRICPVCCSKLRSVECEGCAHYAASVRYKAEKPERERHFITRIEPEVDEECDRILSLIDSGQLSRGEKMMNELFEKHPDYHTVLYG